MLILLRNMGDFRPRSTLFGPSLRAIVTSLIVACSGCAIAPVSPKPVATPSVALRKGSGLVGQASPTTSVIQAQHLEVSEGSEPATGQQPMAAATEKSEAVPTPLPSSALTLDQAINLCLTNDPKIHAGLEIVHQAHADAWTASLPPNPVVDVNGTLLPLGQPFTAARPGGPPELDVGISYPVDWFLFGKRAAAIASASIGVCVSQSDYADLVRQRVAETALAFYDILEAKASLELARQDVENLARVETVTAKAVESGGRPKVELSRVRLELLTSRRELRDAELSLVTAKAKLRALLGAANADLGFDVADTLDAPLTATPLGVEESFSMAAENRPDIISLRRKVAKAEADVVMERRNALPDVKPNFIVGRQYQQSQGFPDVSEWGTGIEVSVPLFNRNQGNRAKTASAVIQSNYELQVGLVELRSEIEQAVQSLQTAQQNAASVAQEELRLAAQVRDSIGKAYEAGGRPLIDVLDAQRNYRDTYRIYITSRADYWRSLYKYNSAIGKQVTQ